MNWSLIGMLVLVLLIVIVIAATTVFFIRHWANRPPDGVAQLPNEGHFFVRHTPDTSPPIEHQPARFSSARLRKYTQYFLSLAVVLGIISLLGAATYYNRDKLAAPIDLTEQDLGELQTTQYQWRQTTTQQLPELAVYTEKLRANKQGLLLIKTPVPKKWSAHAANYSEQALAQWSFFAEQHQLAIEECSWSKLSECRTGKEDWINVLLPGLWDEAGITKLMADSKLIAYGPPLQIYQEKAQPFRIGALSFTHQLTASEIHLTLVADRELTLGFDAGMLIEATPAFKHFRADSPHPQGISINDAHLAGGASSTRLFAKASGTRGRFVWIDISPNESDYEGVTTYYHNSVLASVFRFLEGKPYSAWSNWPQGKTFAALLEEDTEDEYENAYHVATYFKEKNYPITWYALSNEAQEHRSLTRLLAETGEIACHGDNHMDFTLQDLDMQQRRLARCRKVMSELTGQTVVSFRPPREEHNTDTYHAMANNGIRHFIAEVSGDRFTPIIYGHEQDEFALVSIPRMNSDDYLLWDELKLSDAESIAQLKQEVDWIKKIGGLFMFSFHSQYMDSNQHLQTVKDLADYIHSNDAFFTTTNEIAEWWRFRTRLSHRQLTDDDALIQLIERFQPVLLSVNEDGALQHKIISASPENIDLLKTNGHVTALPRVHENF